MGSDGEVYLKKLAPQDLCALPASTVTEHIHVLPMAGHIYNSDLSLSDVMIVLDGDSYTTMCPCY